MNRLILAAVACLLSSCIKLQPDTGEPCADLGTGALITFDIVGEEITLWIDDEDFIEEAIDVLGQGPEVARIPMFDELRMGATCDEEWSFHVDPGDVSWVDAAIELCDARPSYIEDHLTSWVMQVGSWCPWEASVVRVQDLRF